MKNETKDIRQEGLYELREAAEVLGVSPSTIHRWTQKGLIVCYYRKANRRRVWKGKELIKAWGLKH